MDFLRQDEQIALALRGLFCYRGYRHIRPGRFEEYALFLENKNFLDTDSFITFMDAGGKLMALKPDVTLSIIKNLPETSEPLRLCYSDDVYRLSRESQTYTVLNQVGVECVAPDTPAINAEILGLALESLAVISRDAVLDVSHLGFVTGLLDRLGGDEGTSARRRAVLECLHAKNTPELARMLGDGDAGRRVLKLAELHGPLAECLAEAKGLVCCPSMAAAYDQLAAIPPAGNLRLDFSLVNDIDYYNGLIFRGYVSGVSAVVLSGGRYDNLMKRVGKHKHGGAIGFAITLNDVAREQKHENGDAGTVSVALPKGRLGEQVLGLLGRAGYACEELAENSRKLVIEDKVNNIRYFLVKPGDVPIYVERGAADLGIAGKDVLLESGPDVYELLDLGLGRCRVAVAAPHGFADDDAHAGALRVATKYPGIAKRHYASRGRDIELIRLHGSIELAPLLGLSDVIVDIVETGATLAHNDMGVVEDVVDISARLIANKAAYRFKAARIDGMCRAIKEVKEWKS